MAGVPGRLFLLGLLVTASSLMPARGRAADTAAPDEAVARRRARKDRFMPRWTPGDNRRRAPKPRPRVERPVLNPIERWTDAAPTPSPASPPPTAPSPVAASLAPPSAEARAREAALFGAAPPAPEPSAALSLAPPSAEASAREANLFGAPASAPAAPVPPAPALDEQAARKDPLTLGGRLFMEAIALGRSGNGPEDFTLSTPMIVDAYLDGRPNPAVRAFALGRLFFDPTVAEASDMTAPAPLPGARAERGPVAVLDQVWLRCDIADRLFVTAGKQHVRWGTGRFWSPTDYLHVSRRDPLGIVDARPGTTMLKVHLPWEDRGWNLYGFALTEGSESTATVGDVAAAVRAEMVFGTAELGAGLFAKADQRPRLALDVSAGVWDLDVYGELAVRDAGDVSRISRNRNAAPSEDESLPAAVERLFPRVTRSGWASQLVLGATYAQKYADKEVALLGAEYFFNDLGYAAADVYPGLVLPRERPLAEPLSPFYLGRHYGALFLSFPQPYSWDSSTFTLTALGNLSDGSLITRLDYTLAILTQFSLVAHGALVQGRDDGELRAGLRRLSLGPVELERSPLVADFGVALEVKL